MKKLQEYGYVLLIFLAITTATAQTNIGNIGNAFWSLNGNNVNASYWLGSKNDAPIRFKTNSIQRMILTNQGLLGLGTILPENDFHIKKSETGEVGITIENTNTTASDWANTVNLNGDVKTTIGSYKAGGYGYTGTESNHDFFIYSNSTTGFVMKPTGRVGIGITPAVNNPTNTLFIGNSSGSGLSFEKLNTTSPIVSNSVPIGVTSTGEVVRTEILLSKTSTNVSATPVQYVAGNLQISQSNGVILTSDNGNKFRLKIKNNGELLVEPINP